MTGGLDLRFLTIVTCFFAAAIYHASIRKTTCPTYSFSIAFIAYLVVYLQMLLVGLEDLIGALIETASEVLGLLTGKPCGAADDERVCSNSFELVWSV